MHTAASLLIPYLPALAASSPMHDGELQASADARLAWILEHQARIPESCGELVPEYVESFGDYRRSILQPMYAALDRCRTRRPSATTSSTRAARCSSSAAAPWRCGCWTRRSA
jgi:hypothetical protein